MQIRCLLHRLIRTSAPGNVESLLWFPLSILSVWLDTWPSEEGVLDLKVRSRGVFFFFPQGTLSQTSPFILTPIHVTVLFWTSSFDMHRHSRFLSASEQYYTCWVKVQGYFHSVFGLFREEKKKKKGSTST